MTLNSFNRKTQKIEYVLIILLSLLICPYLVASSNFKHDSMKGEKTLLEKKTQWLELELELSA